MQTKFLPHISIIVAAVMLAWYFETFDFGLFKYTSKKKGDAADELLKKKHQVIGKECIPDTTTCFLIVDSYYLENGRLTTKRDLLLEDNTEYSLTGVEVESTKPVSWENLDSRHWPVNKLVINSRYARLLVASGFIMNFYEAFNRLVGDRGPVQDRYFVIKLRLLRLQINLHQLEFRVDMLNQQQNHVAQQLLNVQRPHQIQPPGQQRIVQPVQGLQQNPMQQGQQINMGQPQIANMQGQRQVVQQVPMGIQQMQQPQQAHMMNMGQQIRSQPNPQQQMMPNPHQHQQQQQQMRGNPQQQMRAMPQQGPPVQQQQPPQMSQMRMQQNQQNLPQQQQQQRVPVQNMQQNQQAMRMGQAQNQQVPRMQTNPPQIQMQQQGGHQNMNVPSSQPLQMQHQGVPQNMNRPPSQPHHQIPPGGLQGLSRPPSQQMQHGTPQGINRPPSQLNMQSGGHPNMNRPPSQPHPMQQGGHLNMSRPPSQMQQPGPSNMNTPPQQQMRMQQMQQMQQNQQNMNNEPPHQHQPMHQGQPIVNGPPQQHMRIPQQQQDSQMQQGPVAMNGPPQQPQVRVAQMFQVPPKQQNMQPPPPRQQMPLQQPQAMRGQMQNSPQSSQMRMAPPQQQQPQQQQPQAGQHPIQPIRPIPQMPQGRQMHPNQLRPQQQMQMNRNLPQVSQGGPNVSDQSSMSMQQPPMQSQAMHQQPMQQHNIQQQPMQHQQPPKQQMQQTVQAVNFEPDNGQTIRINGEHAIINGLQYKIVPVPVTQGSDPPLIQNQPIQQNNQNQQQSQSMQQGQPVQQYQQAPQQQRPNTQQRGSNNQMIPNQQQPMQNQQNTPSQQNMPNQQMMPNQQNLQNQLNQSNISNMQNQNPPNNPVAPQQPPPPAKNPKPRYRAKKNNATPAPDLATPVLQQNTPNAADLNNLKPMSNGSMQATPTGSIFGKGGRRIAPPSLTPVPTQAQGQNGMKNTSNITPPPRLIQQGKNMVQVGGLTPNKQHLATPGKNVPRNLQQMKQGSTPIKRLNGKIPMRSQPGPSTSQSKSSENKENMTEIREAIISHVKGTRKMTPEYIEYVCDELTRVLRELEKANLMTDSRYISVQKLLALVKGEKKIRIDVPQRTERPVREPPTENDIDDEPANETPEERKTRYDGYMKMITNAYPMKEFNVNFARIDDDTIRKETVFYREQDMKNREAYLRKNLHTIPEEKQVKAKIEYLGLSLLDFQTELRKKIMATTVLVPPTEFLINPWSIRRTKFEYQQELKQHPDRAALEKKRKSVNYAFLQSLTKHAREFREFHKSNMTKHTKVRKSMQTYITNEAKRVAREEMKNEKLRIQKLIQEDEEGYRAMLDDKKDRRLVYLLEQTDDYIKSLCDLLKQQQDETSSGKNFSKKPTRKEYEGLAEEEKVKSILDKARNDDDEYENKTKMNFEDYYTTAHGVREEITEQHFMMGGGNPSLKLKSYQIKGLEWMVSLFNNNLNGILADEMGLGKTIQTIAFITYLMEIKKTSGPFLVIVPLSTIPNWQNEFLKWAPNVHLIVYKGPKDNRKANEPIIKSGKFNVLLTTFEYVIREKALLGKLRWKYMIIDEGHRLKNQHCKLTEMLNTRFQCQRRLLITGTPLQNKLPELWALLNFLLPSIFSSCSTFEQWFNAPFATTGEKVELTQEETMLIIRRLHKVLRPFLLRRLKKEVESELPDKMEFVIKCEMSGLQKVLYKHMQKGLLLDGKTSTGSRSLMNSMIHLRKLCNHPFLFENVEESCRAFWEARFISSVDLYRVSGKLELLDRILPKLQATGHRVLMFFQMTSMMTVVEDYLAGGSIQYLRLDGSTKPDDRGLLLDKFNAPNSKYFLFMLSTRAGGLGLNLQTADTVIIFDSDWNPHQDMQAQDRAHRIGQKAEVRVFRLITANSVEEKILASARFKLNVDEKVIQAGKFDNRSTGAERRQILENIIKAENESEEDEDVPNDEEINDILSRSEEEFELFQRMDQKRYEHDKREKVKPRLCGDDEIPRDILRAADETDYIEKAKEEGRVPYLEIMPGSRRTRKEVDYSADTMSDDKFLEKLFDGDDVTLAKPEQRPDSKPDSMPGSKPGPSFEAPKESSSEKVAVAEASPGKQPEAPVFKVPRLIVKIGDGLKAKIKKIENDSVLQPLKKERKEKEEDHQKEQKEKDLKRKSDQPPIEKLRIKLPGEPLEKYKKVGEDSVKRDDQDKDRKDEKSHKNRSDDDSSPKKKKQRRDHDADESLEKKKKKHRDHDTDESQDNKKKKHRDHDADGSPEKRKRKHRDNDTDESPEKKKKKHKDKKDSDEPLLKTPETSSPFSMKIKIRPILSEPLKDHPAPTEMSKDRPTLLEPKKERPASSEPSKDRLTLSVPRKERSTFPETSKDRPTSSEPRKVCFNSYEPIKDRPTSSESSKDGSSSTESNKIHPPIKLKLKLMANPVPETSNMDGGSKEKSEKKEPKESKEPKKAKEPKEPKEPTKELKESKDPKEHKERKEHKEHKKKSHENETEEERRARKEAKRLKRQQEEKEDEVRHQEKLARKAARKEQKRLEQQNLENATTSVNEKAAGSA